MKLLRFAIVAGLVFGLELAEPQPLIGQIRGQSRFSQDPLLLVPGKYRNAILFDDYLAPQGNFTELPERANDVLIAHRIAQQQINLAIAYLKSNRLQILAGSDPFWNEVYGKITKMTQVAHSLPEALEIAAQASSRDDLICVTGSFYLVGETKVHLRELASKK